MYNQTEKVNIRPKSYLPVFRVSQNDVGRTLTAHLVSDEGDISIPAGATVTMAGTKPSGLGYTVTGTVDGSNVSFETDAVMTDEPGRIVSEIRIVQDGTVIGTTNIVLVVEPDPHPDDTTDGQREQLVNEITALLEQITEQADRAEAVTQAVIDMTVTAHESDEVTVTKTEGEVVNLDFGLPRGPQGPQGIPGQDGQDGVTPDFSVGTVETLAPGEQATATITGTDEDPVLNLGIPRGAKGDKGDPGEVTQEDFDKLLITDTASGEIATFPDGAEFPMRSLKVSLSPIQSGSGTPSPDNVRPISGWDSVETVVSGKNLVDVADGSITTTTNIVTKELQAGTYTASVYGKRNDGGLWRILIIEDGGETIATSTNGSTTSLTRCYATFTLEETTNVRIQIQFLTSYDTIQYERMQLELDSTATEYEPYQGTTYQTTLPQTVYGGTLDVVSGVLTVDRAMVDLGTLTWYNHSSGVFWAIVNGKEKGVSNIVCSQYETSQVPGVGNLQNCQIVGENGGYAVYVKDTRFTTDATEFKTAMNGVQLCYTIATPTTIQCDPQTVQTLMGDNNIWGGDEVQVEYYADTKLYIEKRLGA